MREKLIELLLHFDEHCVTELCCEKCTHKDNEDCEVNARADHLIANGVTIAEDSNVLSKWIPVSERLPEDDEQVKFSDDGRMRFTTVLAYTEYRRIIPKNRLIVRPTGIEYLDTQVTDGYIWGGGTGKVTHWMPLPTPPKGESDHE